MITKIFRPIQDFFLWSSGADLTTLEKVPSEKNKYYGIGGTIVFTALMASFAGGYAFFTAFREPIFESINGVVQQKVIGYSFSSKLLATFFGLFWGALIYNLDRFIVSTFGVGDGKKTISRQELIEAAPRLIMAVILGFVISTPLELKIFEKEIQTKVERLKIVKSMELSNSDTLFNNNLDKKEIRLTKIENKINDLRNNKQQLLANSVAFIDSRKAELKSDLRQKEAELSSVQNKVNVAHENYMRAINNSSPQAGQLEKIYKDLGQNRNRIRNEKQIIDDKITALENDKETQLREESSSLDNEIKTYTTEKNQLIDEISGLSKTKNDKEVNYKNVSENYDGFAAHLEALSELADDKPIVKFSKWLITLLFIFIEIAPILFKMMTERGPYDDMLDRLKHDVKVKELLAISNINEEVNTLVQINRDKNAQKLSTELAANNSLLSMISEAQAEIARAAIEEWKRKQIEEVIANPEILIKDNIKEHI